MVAASPVAQLATLRHPARAETPAGGALLAGDFSASDSPLRNCPPVAGAAVGPGAAFTDSTLLHRDARPNVEAEQVRRNGTLGLVNPATLAGAEGFEPSALGFGDRCSDQTELRP